MANKKAKAGEAADKATTEKVVGMKSAPKAAVKGKDEAVGPVARVTTWVEQGKEFFDQSKVEMKKVTWPTRQETVQTGIAVLVFSVVVAIFLGVVDFGLSRFVAFILSLGT